ncbi:hypothetical protein BHAOGJBA_1680 [Methylobacterium hispanicum]|uniref:Phage tail protein n=1 Tax=Methylobacterium hispanicum TaxID=270350 RepID=A0AAV4ZJ03_9HYPH|nr:MULTISPECIES: tail protein X [Methylobacterium]GJD88167.1 hypothetical protein BHAOGJBA_1680 [Methylobacterium hispanicum]
MPTTIRVAGEKVTLDLLLWRHGKRRGATSARLAETLALNPGLAAFGPYIPVGTPVLIPDLPPERERRLSVTAVSLFD